MSHESITEDKSPAEIFTSGGLEPILKKIEEEARALVPDMTTEAGRKAIASMAYGVARKKTWLDDMGKELVSEWKSKSALVDAERRKVRDRLEALKDEVRKPLTDWENSEKKRVDDLKSRMQSMIDCGRFLDISTSTAVQERTLQANQLYQYNWEEFQSMADTEYETVQAALSTKMEERKKYEAEQAELERLRQESAERERKDREQTIANEAAAKARKDAEAQAEADRLAAAQAAEAEQKKTEQARIDAENRAAQAEREKTQAAEKAENDRLAQVQATRDAEERAANAEAEKKALEEKIAKEAAEKKEAVQVPIRYLDLVEAIKELMLIVDPSQFAKLNPRVQKVIVSVTSTEAQAA